MLLAATLAFALPAELAAILDLAQAAPPELEAHAMLRVVESGKVTGLQARRELIDSAWDRAQLAREPNPRKTIQGTPPEARVSRGALALGLGLDRVSLEHRAIAATLRFSPARARQMLESSQYPAPRKLSCADTLWDDLSPYFRSVAAISKHAYSPEERRGKRHLDPVLRAIERMQSPVEIAPAIRMVNAMEASEEERDIALRQLAGAIERIHGDDRSFSTSLYEANQYVKPLPPLAAVWRGYLRRHFTPRRCAESIDENWPYRSLRDELGKEWNLPPEHLKPESTAGAADLPSDYGRPEAVALRKMWFDLMFGNRISGNGNAALSDERKNTPEWREQFAAYAKAVEALEPLPGQNEADHWAFKYGYIEAMVAALPPGDERDRFLERQIHYLEHTPLRQKDWIQWMWQAENCVSVTKSLRKADLDRVLMRYERSPDASIALWGKLRRVLGE